MKKFLIFLVSLVVVVCVGLTTFYFMRNNEVITIKTKEIYCNAGDTIPLSSLGISIKKANVSNKTKFNYNAGGDDVTKYIKYDESIASFVVSQENAGHITLIIGTTNKKYSEFTINVHIGNGSIENPYYIFNETDLMKIGSTYRLDKSYVLMNDITLTSSFSPIGYNSNTDTWESFNGTFNGNNHTIKAMNLSGDYANAGLFSSLGANSSVKNLKIDGATINGAYENAGVLAGTSNGIVEKVVVTNSTITNTASNSVTGALVGDYAGDALKLSYADNVKINLGDDANAVTNALAGGLVGKLNETLVQACYTNGVEINSANATATIGGFAGEFVIGTETGSIQQSYANTVCADSNFAAFVATISKSADFNAEKANMLRHLIGNMAVVYGKADQANIVDADLVKSYDTNFFKNETYVDRSVFFEKDSAMYLIRGFAGEGNLIETNEFIYYAIDMNNVTNWDTTYVWNVNNNALPILRMGSVYPEAPSGEYFRRNLEEKPMGNKETFVDLFKQDVVDQKIKLLDDMDLSNGWTPVAVKNTTIDGDNHTITINLNNAVDGNLGLFSTVDNCSIKNLNIKVVGVSANATNAGALAAKIISTDALANSTIENVNVEYVAFENPIITNFGGIAGTIENTVITNSVVKNLTIGANSKLENAGAIVAVLNKNSTVSNSEIKNATICASKNVGGVAAINNSTITGIKGNVAIIYNSAAEAANVGGVVGTNNKTVEGEIEIIAVVDNINLTANITVTNTGSKMNIGGVAGNNNAVISNVTISGEKIAIEVENQNVIYVGGVVGTNNSTIENAVINIESVGTYHIGTNHYVGGVAAINNGAVSKVLIQSNMEGNYVGGVVAQMNSSTIDQVAVGKFDATTRVLSKNTLKADKYIAGIVVDFRAGAISNIQSSSKIEGQTNSTRSSLVTLIFPYGTSLKNATIDSSIEGYGIKYRETWVDFASYSNKAEFGQSSGSRGDSRYNIYAYDTEHGSMQSVVINSKNTGVGDAVSAMGTGFLWMSDYADTDESSFIKVVDGFNSVSQFQGSFEFVCSKTSVFGIEQKVTRTLNFGIGSVWESNNGISLICLNNLVEKVA